MAYSYDEHMGDPQPAHMGSQSETGTQMAGDVIDISDAMKNIKQSVGISRSLGGLPNKGGTVTPHPLNPMGGYGK